MFSLQDLLGQQQGDDALSQISNQVGAEPSAVNSAISLALPAILGGMAQRQQQPEYAPVINNAIMHEQGGILDNIGAMFGGGGYNPMTSAGMLGTIFGNNQTQVANQIGQQSGLSGGQVASILMMLAPLVLGYLGRQQSQQGLDAGGIGGMLGGYQNQIQQQQPGLGGLLGGLLGGNQGGGGSLGDLIGLAGQFMR